MSFLEIQKFPSKYVVLRNSKISLLQMLGMLSGIYLSRGIMT